MRNALLTLNEAVGNCFGWPVSPSSSQHSLSLNACLWVAGGRDGLFPGAHLPPAKQPAALQ